MKYWDVIVFYDAKHYDSDGYDGLLDEATGKIPSGSGMGMGFRDVEWEFKTRKEALSAASRIADLRLPGVKGLWVRDYNDAIIGLWKITPALLGEFIPEAQRKFKRAPRMV